MDPGPIPLLSMSIYLVTIGRNQFESAIKPARVDLDTLFTDYTAIYFRFSTNLLCGLYPIELWAGDIIGVNVVVNENDMQIIADIVYNDVNIQLLFSGYGLFLALVNVFGFYLIMVSQDRSA